MLSMAICEAEHELSQCRKTHVSMLEPGVFGIDVRR